MLNPQERVLLFIDMISMEADFNMHPGFVHDDNGTWVDDDGCAKEIDVSEMSRERLEKDWEQAKMALSQIYRFSHAGFGRCGNAHEDWIKEFLEAEEKMIKMHQYAHPVDFKEAERELVLPLPKNRTSCDKCHGWGKSFKDDCTCDSCGGSGVGTYYEEEHEECLKTQS
tara:strand:- start:570 stop:1076 length:507 start_codon:yes stop_codon:yes gene_type:complete